MMDKTVIALVEQLASEALQKLQPDLRCLLLKPTPFKGG